jgi:prepilin-type N-terminal cleavage/methylation domain-containing protein/prepilin-type processing-associated H-X9-DG protein
METTMQRHKARGFTLIEMLVVIAVVMVLMLLLWPTCICRSRPAARTASCLSNLKQLGVAAAMYIQDYDDTLFWNPPPAGPQIEGQSTASGQSDCARQAVTSFIVLLYPYTAGAAVFRCPEYPGYATGEHLGYEPNLIRALGDPVSVGVHRTSDDAAWASKIGYGFNEVLVGSPCRPRTLDSLKSRPEEVALLADAEEPWASGSGAWVQDEDGWRRYWELKPGETPRHGRDKESGQNFVFVDGHAKFLRPLVTAEESRRGYYRAAKLE